MQVIAKDCTTVRGQCSLCRTMQDKQRIARQCEDSAQRRTVQTLHDLHNMQDGAGQCKHDSAHAQYAGKCRTTANIARQSEDSAQMRDSAGQCKHCTPVHNMWDSVGQLQTLHDSPRTVHKAGQCTKRDSAGHCKHCTTVRGECRIRDSAGQCKHCKTLRGHV